jgi:large subunit ribosomal protein L21
MSVCCLASEEYGTVYAIIQHGGHQYRVSPGETVRLERFDAEPGAALELGEVVFIGGDKAQVGRPFVEGALVKATVVGPEKGKKLTVFKYKRKNRYRVKTGHRQHYTRVSIDAIEGVKQQASAKKSGEE